MIYKGKKSSPFLLNPLLIWNKPNDGLSRRLLTSITILFMEMIFHQHEASYWINGSWHERASTFKFQLSIAQENCSQVSGVHTGIESRHGRPLQRASLLAIDSHDVKKGNSTSAKALSSPSSVAATFSAPPLLPPTLSPFSGFNPAHHFAMRSTHGGRQKDGE
jgi:hypothetical protein